MTTQTQPQTASTYQEALEWVRKNPGKTTSWDAGEGYTSSAYWCPRRKRVIYSGTNAKGGHY